LLVVIAIIAILAAILFPVFARAREKARASSCLANVKQISLAIQMYSNDYDESYPLVNQARPTGGNTAWATRVFPYVKNTGIFLCPSREKTNVFTNGIGFMPGAPAFSRADSLNDWSSYGANLYVMSWGTPGNIGGFGAVPTGWPDEKELTPVRLAELDDPASIWVIADASVYFIPPVVPAYGYISALGPPDWSGRAEPANPSEEMPHFGGLNVGYADGHAKYLPYEKFANNSGAHRWWPLPVE